MLGGIGELLLGSFPRSFDLQLRCYSIPFFENADSQKINDLNHGGKILLPPSALDQLVRLNIEYPMMFKVSNERLDIPRSTHCGVQEFLAQEGCCYLPSWMMVQLLLKEGDSVHITYFSLPKATYAKFKPQSTDFLSISNPRAVLEVELRKFACLTKGDIIAVQYNDQVLEFLVMEVKPGNAVQIIECDMNVEFDAPEGYVEPQSQEPSGQNQKAQQPIGGSVSKGASTSSGFTAFGGSGHRLDGKSKASSASLKSEEKKENSLPELHVFNDYLPGELHFIRYEYKNRLCMEKELAKNDEKPGFVPFSGSGRAVGTSRRR
ncbi:hypothetical protein AB6A40_000651 [Gnathostoma spinigerum]|uniref:Ubiquitin fusion degradaton protein n=1 Tax=Gnathostoma spinigerum TaxID=75299 RepID=A0ABD6EBS6_9BILA